MKTAWILCIMATQYGCIDREVHGIVYAYNSEIECNAAMNKISKEYKDNGEDVWHKQCQSVDSLLVETEKKS